MNHPLAWKFRGIYANLPLGLRKEVVAVVNDEPMSWQVIKLEIDAETQAGFDALEFLKRIGVLE